MEHNVSETKENFFVVPRAKAFYMHVDQKDPLEGL